MNIFILDKDPQEAARQNCDKHVIKIILECFVMLQIAHDATRKGWRNNPVSKWVRASLSNYRWSAAHAMALCEEYTYRYGGKVHKLQPKIEWFLKNEPNIQDIGLTEIYQAMPDDVRQSDPIEAYRQYYMKYKSGFAKWTKRPIPDWYKA